MSRVPSMNGVYGEICAARYLRAQGYRVDTRLRNKTKDILGLEAGISKRQYPLF